MNRSFPVALCLALAFVLEGCSHGIHSETGGWPPASSSSPASISSSADVVKVRAADVSIPAGGNADATVTLSISPGYHINANPATFSYLIATEVRQVPAPHGICVAIGKVVYPTGINKKFVFAEKPLAVYEGEVVIKLPVHVPRPNEGGCYGYLTKGAQDSLPIEVRIQACDSEKCYPPTIVDATVTVDVK